MNTEASIGFGIKAYLKVSPFTSLGVGISFFILFLGLGMRMLEFYNLQIMELMSIDGYNQSFVGVMMKFQNFLNAFWLILVTMTTSKLFVFN